MSGLVPSPQTLQDPSTSGWHGGMVPGTMSGMPSNAGGVVGVLPPGMAVPGLHPTANVWTTLHHATVFPNQGAGMEPAPGLISPMGASYPHPSQDRYHSVAIIPPPQ